MLKYIKYLKFWEKDYEGMEELHTEDLTDDQKKKYRKQFIYSMLNGLGLSFVYIVAVINMMGLIFEFKRYFFLGAGIIIILIESYLNNLLMIKEEIDLINERIKRRARKNIKKEDK